MKKLLFIFVLFCSCTVQRGYNYLIIDHTNRIKQTTENVTKNDVLRIIDYVIIASQHEFEIKVSRVKTFEDDTTKFYRKSILEPVNTITGNQNKYQ